VTTLVDANVLLDILTEDEHWFDWSEHALVAAAAKGELAINPIVYAEVAVGFATIEELDESLADFQRLPLPYEAGFLAARCFVRYRRAGAARRSPLPDFYIGAHAAVTGLELLTRDAARYRTYFPRLTIIAPDAAADRDAEQ
jgi:predicted nucleic acid-binding protein